MKTNRHPLNKARWIFILLTMVLITMGCIFTEWLPQPKPLSEVGEPLAQIPEQYSCTPEAGLLFWADYPHEPSGSDGYVVFQDIDIYLRFDWETDSINLDYMTIDYAYNVTFHPPILSEEGAFSHYGVQEQTRSGMSDLRWDLDLPGYLFGELKEKVTTEWISPPGDSSEGTINYYIVALASFDHGRTLYTPQPAVHLCFDTAPFNKDAIKAAGVDGFAGFCSLPQQGFLVCNPR